MRRKDGIGDPEKGQRETRRSLRLYHPERARSRLISEAKQGRAWLVLGWEKQEEEEITEEPKRFTVQEMPRGFCLSEEALLVLEAQDLNMEQYTKSAAAIPNAVPCCRVTCDEKRAPTQVSLDHLFRIVFRGQWN